MPSRRLRVAWVYRNFNDGGSIPSAFRDRAERLAHDEDVTAVCSARTRAPTAAPLAFETVEPLLRSDGRVGYAVECASFAVSATRLLRRLRGRFDVVHVEGTSALAGDMVTVHAVRPAEIAHYFDHVEPQARLRRRLSPLLRPHSAVVKAIERRLLRPPYPYCIAVSRAVAADLGSHYGVPPDAVAVVPYWIDAGAFRFDDAARARLRSRHGVPSGRLVVLFVGDDFERKGLDRAIEGVAKADVDAELWVAGGGDDGRYAALARSAGIGDRVRFLGRTPRAELPGTYSACDVLLLPSRQDAWGLPVVEALAAGRVVAVSEFTGAHEVLEHGESGFVLGGAGSAAEIASLLEGPVARADARRRIGEAAAQRAAAFDRAPVYERLRAAHRRAYERRLEQPRRG